MANDFVLKGKELYRGGDIRIHKSMFDIDEHDVVIRENYVFLDRGIMHDWASASISRIQSSYFNIKRISYEIENPSVPVEEFRWALCQATIKDLENKLYNS